VSIDRLAAPQPGSAFRHEAFLYRGRDEFVSGTVSFIREGVANDESVMVVLPSGKVELVQAALRHESTERVVFVDMDVLGRNPGRLIPYWRDFLDEHGGGDKRVRGIGEPIGPHQHGPQLDECQRHESLFNLAFVDMPGLWVLCPYDVSVLSDRVIDEARRAHPYVLEQGQHLRSMPFRDIGALVSHSLGETLPPAPASAMHMDFELARLRALRAFVTLHAVEMGLDLERTADLVLAVNELAANSVQHANGYGTLRLWREGDTLLCEVEDDGRITNPLAGRQAPGSFDDASRGLWVVNQLCDLVQIRSSTAGTIVRLHMALPS
jgi:anti-sigma regulatory factor (Ser/Thr protein kinase)